MLSLLQYQEYAYIHILLVNAHKRTHKPTHTNASAYAGLPALRYSSARVLQDCHICSKSEPYLAYLVAVGGPVCPHWPLSLSRRSFEFWWAKYSFPDLKDGSVFGQLVAKVV